MQIFRNIAEMQRWSLEQRRSGKRIAFIPTMGALHDGHLSLLKEGKKRAELLVLSIYVNPAQFGPNEDLSKYPRDFEGDIAKVKPLGVDAVFFPSDAMMYPDGYQTSVEVEKLTRYLCGASRPGHFRGVTTVVAKLLNIVQPDVALFGEKDFQQLAAIRRMASDLNMLVEIVGCPIVRESDGLAMSSRNAYLSADERRAALSLPRSIEQAQGMARAGERDAGRILARVRSTIEAEKIARIDYAKIVDARTLEDIKSIDHPAALVLAAFVGKTRLIDNCQFLSHS